MRTEDHTKPERNTINRAELAAIAQVLIDNASVQILRIPTDSAFCIYVIRNFITSPSSYEGYLHEDLLHLIADMLLHRESQQYYTHIGKVKSHTGIQYNEIADQTANKVATGETENPDIEFTQADPITTGLRTWLLHDDPQDTESEDEPPRRPFAHIQPELKKKLTSNP